MAGGLKALVFVWTLDVDRGCSRQGGYQAHCPGAPASAEDSGTPGPDVGLAVGATERGSPATPETLPHSGRGAHSRLHWPDGPQAGESAPPARETRRTSLGRPEPRAPHPAPPHRGLWNHGVVSATAAARGDSEVPRGIWRLPPRPLSGGSACPWGLGGSRLQGHGGGGALGNNARASPPDAKGGVWGWPSLENSRMGEVRALDRPGWGRASRGPQHGPCADWLVGRGRGCWAGPPPVRKSPG